MIIYWGNEFTQHLLWEERNHRCSCRIHVSNILNIKKEKTLFTLQKILLVPKQLFKQIHRWFKKHTQTHIEIQVKTGCKTITTINNEWGKCDIINKLIISVIDSDICYVLSLQRNMKIIPQEKIITYKCSF